MNVPKAKLAAAIFAAVALMSQPVNAQQKGMTLTALLQQGYEIKALAYHVGLLVQKGAVVYACSWGNDGKTSCLPLQ
jgi:hypothetical protein